MDRLYKAACISIVLGMGLSIAGPDEEAFLHANHLYHALEYDKALGLYDSVRNKTHGVWYNRGNCFFYLRNYPAALCSWEKAKSGSSTQELKMIEHNKDLVFAQLNKKADTRVMNRFFNYLSLYLSYRSMQLLFLLLWYAVLLLAYKKALVRKWHTLVVCFIVFVSGIFLSCYAVHALRIQAIVMNDQAPFFAGPSDQFPCRGMLNSADYVEVKDAREGWYKVRYFDTIGWMKADMLEIIK